MWNSKRSVHVKTSQRAGGSFPFSMSTWPLQRLQREVSSCWNDLNSCQVKNASAFVSWVIRTRTFSLEFFFFGERKENYSLFFFQFTHICLVSPQNERLSDQSESRATFLGVLCHMFVFEVFFMNRFSSSVQYSFSSGTFYSFHIPSTFASALFFKSLEGEFPIISFI